MIDWRTVVAVALLAIPVLATGAMFADAARRFRDVRRQKRNGPRRLISAWAVRRELLRIVKQSLLLYGLAVVFFGAPTPFGWDTIATRTVIIAVVYSLMGVTSLDDMRHTRKVDVAIDSGH